MAELATIARPYAEALYQSVAGSPQGAQVLGQLDTLAALAADDTLRQFADNPKVTGAQVLEVIASLVDAPLLPPVANLLAAVVENGRLAALPEIAAQFRALANAQSGIADAIVYSAFPVDAAQLAELTATLERRFGRRLNPSVQLDPGLIGGVRVVVGDEVLDTSVAARLQKMKQALSA